MAKVYYAKVNSLFELRGFTKKIFEKFTLERGIVAGLVLLGLGILVNLKVVFNWYMKGFGELTFFEVKIALVAFTLMTVGVELIFSSFLLSIISRK
jgi:hypothetical protein